MLGEDFAEERGREHWKKRFFQKKNKKGSEFYGLHDIIISRHVDHFLMQKAYL